MALNAAQLVEAIANEHNLPKTVAKSIVEGLFDSIKAELEIGESVSIHNFGSFNSVTRAARTARNPANGGTVEVPAKVTVKFKPAKALKDALN